MTSPFIPGGGKVFFHTLIFIICSCAAFLTADSTFEKLIVVALFNGIFLLHEMNAILLSPPSDPQS